MSDTYTEIYYHLVWTTKNREAMIVPMNKIKGSSAHLINHLPANRHPLAWQPGYGALTFARRDLKPIVAYIQSQQQHHRDGMLSPDMERSHTERLFPSPGGAL